MGPATISQRTEAARICRSSKTDAISIHRAVVVTTACRQSEKKLEPKAARTALEETAEYGDLIPLAEGGAYLVSSRAVFYIAGAKVTPVAGLPTDLLLVEVVPLADGTAILRQPMSDPPRLYVLSGATAAVVSETVDQPPTPRASANKAGFLFAENQRLRAAIDDTEDRSFDPGADSEPAERDY